MKPQIYRFTFEPSVSVEKIRENLFLSAVSAEGVYGQSQVKMDFAFSINEETWSCLIDGSTPVGRHITRVFTSFMSKQLEDEEFRVERVEGTIESTATGNPGNHISEN